MSSGSPFSSVLVVSFGYALVRLTMLKFSISASEHKPLPLGSAELKPALRSLAASSLFCGRGVVVVVVVVVVVLGQRARR